MSVIWRSNATSRLRSRATARALAPLTLALVLMACTGPPTSQAPAASGGSTPVSAAAPTAAAAKPAAAPAGSPAPAGAAAPAGSPAPATASAPAAKPESEIVVAGGGGVIAQTTKSILEPWGAKNGVKLTYIEANSTASLAKIQAGAQSGLREIDVAVNNEQSIALGRPNNLWEALNPDLVPNIKNLDQEIAFPTEYLGTPPVGVRAWVIPTGLAYNTEVFKKNGWDPPSSWEDLYSPKFANCTLPLSPKSGVPYIPMLNFINSGDFSNISVTLQRFKAIAKSVPAFTDSNVPALELLQQGTGCLIPSQLHRTLEQQAKGAPIELVYAKEGTPFVGASLAIVKNAPHPVAAQLAVNEMLTADSALKWQEGAYLITTNLSAKRSTSGLAAKLLVASEFRTLGLKDTPKSAFDNLDSWYKLWDEMAAGG